SSSTTVVGAPTVRALTSVDVAGGTPWASEASRTAHRTMTAEIIRDLPIGVRGAVADKPVAQQSTVGAPSHAVARVERCQRALQRRQPVERHTGEIVMLEVIVRIEKHKI